MASDHRMLQAGDQSFLQETAGVRIKKRGAFQRKQGASCCTQPVKSIMYLVLNGASSIRQHWTKPGPKQPANLSCLLSPGARAEGQQLQRVKHVFHRGE